MMTDLPTMKRSADEVERDVLAYEALVADALGDLPLEVQSELLDGLHDHLVEIAAEGDLIELIGPADLYAAELRGDAEPVRLAAEPVSAFNVVGESRAEAGPPMPRIDVPWTRIAQIAGAALVGLYGTVLLFNLNGAATRSDIVIAALIAGGALAAAWWAAQRMVRPATRQTVGIVLMAVALLVAARLGADAGARKTRQDLFPPDAYAPATTFPPPANPAFSPDVRGMRRNDASVTLSNLGLVVAVEEVPVARADGDVVIDQQPPGGTFIAPGSTVVIRIATSSGPEPTLSASSTFPPVSTQVAALTTVNVASVTTLAG